MTLRSIGGTLVHAESVGDGPAVLVLHGGFCSMEALRPLAQVWAGWFTVHAFERPGHGRSPDVPGPYSYTGGLETTLAYLDILDPGPVHVVGFSDGAIMGLLLALHHPDRVRSLVAISANLDPTAFTDAGPTLPRPPSRAPRPDAERQWYERLSPDGPAHADVVVAKLLHLWSSEPHIDPDDLARITAPVLVVSGDRDTIPPAHSLLIASRIPDSRLCILPDATHDLVSEHPALLTDLVAAFLRGRDEP